jgi:hypothetical protein
MRWSSVALNPYQPPQCIEPAAEVAGAAVVQVRYHLAYSLLAILAGLVMIASAISIYHLIPLASWLFFFAGTAHLVMGFLTRRRPFFEVFSDRIEFLSPVFPRWRRAKPIESVGDSFLYRCSTRREDFKRYIAWREDQVR